MRVQFLLGGNRDTLEALLRANNGPSRLTDHQINSRLKWDDERGVYYWEAIGRTELVPPILAGIEQTRVVIRLRTFLDGSTPIFRVGPYPIEGAHAFVEHTAVSENGVGGNMQFITVVGLTLWHANRLLDAIYTEAVGPAKPVLRVSRVRRAWHNLGRRLSSLSFHRGHGLTYYAGFIGSKHPED